MKILKTLIVEDEIYIRKGLISMINSINNESISLIGECGTVKDAVAVANACNPDLIFLDINLTDGTGLDFLEQTQNLNYQVIFITAYEQYAIQAIKNGALDYILKPVDIEELENAIEKAVNSTQNIEQEQLQVVKNQLINNKKDRLVLRLHDGFQVINFESLMYCKSDKGYTTFYLSDGKSYMASKPIKEFESSLPESTFLRTHQSYVVNLSYVDKYDKNGYIFLRSGEKIPVSTRKKEEFVNKLFGN